MNKKLVLVTSALFLIISGDPGFACNRSFSSKINAGNTELPCCKEFLSINISHVKPYELGGFAMADVADIYVPYLHVGGRRFINSKKSDSTAVGSDIFIPFWQNTTNIVFADIRFYDRFGQTFEGNAHVGWRYLDIKRQNVYGVYSAVDRKRSELGNYYKQLTFGVECWLDKLFIGGNFYQPIGEDSNLLSRSVNPDSVRLDNIGRISATKSKKYEKAMGGFDGEIGYEIAQGLTGYFGGYYFKAKDMESIYGPKAKLSCDLSLDSGKKMLGVFDKVGLELGVQHDKGRGTSWCLGANLTIGLLRNNTNSYLYGVSRHMVDLVRRDVDIVTDVRTIEDKNFIKKKGKILRIEDDGGTAQTTLNDGETFISFDSLESDNKIHGEIYSDVDDENDQFSVNLSSSRAARVVLPPLSLPLSPAFLEGSKQPQTEVENVVGKLTVAKDDDGYDGGNEQDDDNDQTGHERKPQKTSEEKNVELRPKEMKAKHEQEAVKNIQEPQKMKLLETPSKQEAPKEQQAEARQKQEDGAGRKNSSSRDKGKKECKEKEKQLLVECQKKEEIFCQKKGQEEAEREKHDQEEQAVKEKEQKADEKKRQPEAENRQQAEKEDAAKQKVVNEEAEQRKTKDDQTKKYAQRMLEEREFEEIEVEVKCAMQALQEEGLVISPAKRKKISRCVESSLSESGWLLREVPVMLSKRNAQINAGNSMQLPEDQIKRIPSIIGFNDDTEQDFSFGIKMHAYLEINKQKYGWSSSAAISNVEKAQTLFKVLQKDFISEHSPVKKISVKTNEKTANHSVELIKLHLDLADERYKRALQISNNGDNMVRFLMECFSSNDAYAAKRGQNMSSAYGLSSKTPPIKSRSIIGSSTGISSENIASPASSKVLSRTMSDQTNSLSPYPATPLHSMKQPNLTVNKVSNQRVSKKVSRSSTDAVQSAQLLNTVDLMLKTNGTQSSTADLKSW